MFNLKVQYLDRNGEPVARDQAVMSQYGDSLRVGYDGRVWVRINGKGQWVQQGSQPT
jgi:hypothetical protein